MRLLFYLLIFTLAGCDSMTDDHSAPENGHAIDFSALNVGQESSYVRFEGEDYRDTENLNFEYTPDTLVVQVVQATEGGYVFMEYLRPGSRGLVENDAFYMPDSIRYLVSIVDDQLRVSGIDQLYHLSHLFWNYQEALPLEDTQENEVDIRGWKTSLPFTELYRSGYVVDFQLFGKTYSRLNVVVDDTDMQVDGPGKTFLYSIEEGIVRSSSASAWTGHGWGWDRLP